MIRNGTLQSSNSRRFELNGDIMFEVVFRHFEEMRALFANNKLEREMLLQKLESEKLVFRGDRGILLVRQASEIMEFDAIHYDMWSRIKDDHRRELTHCCRVWKIVNVHA